MDAGVVVAIVGIVAAGLAAYHIAFRQGVFSQPRVRVSFGQDGNEHSSLYALLFGIPARKAQRYVLDLPVFLLNEGRRAIEHTDFQLAFPARRAAASLVGDRRIARESGLRGEQWRLTRSGELAIADYHLPVMPLDDKSVLSERLQYKESELCAGICADRFSWTLRGVTVREQHGSFWVVAVRAESLDELKERAEEVRLDLFSRDQVKLLDLPADRSGLIARRALRPVLASQLAFKVVASETALDLLPDRKVDSLLLEFIPVRRTAPAPVARS